MVFINQNHVSVTIESLPTKGGTGIYDKHDDCLLVY